MSASVNMRISTHVRENTLDTEIREVCEKKSQLAKLRSRMNENVPSFRESFYL